MNEVIKLTSGEREIEVVRTDGTTFNWKYDVVAVKLQCEELLAAHGITDRVPNSAFLVDLAPKLFEGCSIDAAYKICHLVNQQFQLMHQSLSEQLKAIR